MKKLIITFLLFILPLFGEDLGYLVNDLNQSKNNALLYDSKKINFIFYIKNKNYKKVEDFILKYENIDFVLKDNNTPLFYAIDLGDLKAVKLLIQHGADIYHINSSLETALHIAVKRDNAKIVRYLLEEGVKVSNRDSYGNTALFYAKQSGNNEIIELLNYYKKTKVKKVNSLEDFIKNF